MLVWKARAAKELLILGGGLLGSLEALFLLTARGQMGMHKVMAGLPSASFPTSVMAQKPWVL